MASFNRPAPGRKVRGVRAGKRSLAWRGPTATPAMHTHDMENHDNLYADEGVMVIGETPADARSHALWAVGAVVLMVAGLGITLILT
jgi:hypothetical protein